MTDYWKQAVHAAREGDGALTQRLLYHHLKANPKDANGWCLLSHVVDGWERKEECLLRSLEINPQHQEATKRLLIVRKRIDGQTIAATMAKPDEYHQADRVIAEGLQQSTRQYPDTQADRRVAANGSEFSIKDANLNDELEDLVVDRAFEENQDRSLVRYLIEDVISLPIISSARQELWLGVLLKGTEHLQRYGLIDQENAVRKWFFHEEAVPGMIAKRFGDAVLQEANIEDVEVFPKQEELTTGPGSLIRLPFGRHQKSGKIYSFVDPDGLLLAPTIREQIAILAGADEVPKKQATEYAEAIPDGPEAISSPVAELPVWEKIKRVAPAMEFISQYVELEPTASGGVGHCPFHDDRHKSFGVNEEGNFWNCFAGCGGGSVIDFYMRYKRVDFGQAIEEMGVLLGINT